MRGPRGPITASQAGPLDLTTGEPRCRELLALHAMVAAPGPKTYDSGGRMRRIVHGIIPQEVALFRRSLVQWSMMMSHALFLQGYRDSL